MAEREQFSFSNLGVTSTEEIDGVQAGEMFLSSNPEDIKFVDPRKQTEEKEEEELEEKVETKKAVRKDPKTKKVEEQTTPRELGDKQLFDVLDEKSEEEDDEDIEESVVDNKNKAKDVTSKEEGSEEDNVFGSIANELLNHGIFNLDEDEEALEIDSPEELLTRFQYEAKKQASFVIEKFLSRYGDNYRDMFQNVFVNGVDPVEYLNRYTKVESVKDLDLADEGNQEKIVRELYRSEGRSSEYIDKKITQLKNYNDLLDEATEAQKLLVTKQQKEIDDAASKKQQEIERNQQIRNEYVNNVGRILSDKIKAKDFDGIPVDRKFAEQTYAYATQERFQTPDGQLLTTFDKDILELKRPENHELKVKVAMLMQLLKEDPQLTKLAKRAVSKESNELFKGLKKTAMKTASKKEEGEETKVKSWF